MLLYWFYIIRMILCCILAVLVLNHPRAFYSIPMNLVLLCWFYDIFRIWCSCDCFIAHYILYDLLLLCWFDYFPTIFRWFHVIHGLYMILYYPHYFVLILYYSHDFMLQCWSCIIPMILCCRNSFMLSPISFNICIALIFILIP